MLACAAAAAFGSASTVAGGAAAAAQRVRPSPVSPPSPRLQARLRLRHGHGRRPAHGLVHHRPVLPGAQAPPGRPPARLPRPAEAWQACRRGRCFPGYATVPCLPACSRCGATNCWRRSPQTAAATTATTPTGELPVHVAASVPPGRQAGSDCACLPSIGPGGTRSFSHLPGGPGLVCPPAGCTGSCPGWSCTM